MPQLVLVLDQGASIQNTRWRRAHPATIDRTWLEAALQVDDRHTQLKEERLKLKVSSTQDEKRRLLQAVVVKSACSRRFEQLPL
jgi:hypothetical protein